jgi:hypothetical protein
MPEPKNADMVTRAEARETMPPAWVLRASRDDLNPEPFRIACPPCLR